MTEIPEQDAFLEIVGTRIKQLRHAAGWTQGSIAQRLGVSLRAYQRLESGQSNLNLRTLFRIAQALQVRPSQIFVFPETGELD